MTATKVLGRFPAGAPRGSWPAEEFARARRLEGLDAEVVMDLPSDTFLVVGGAVGGGADADHDDHDADRPPAARTGRGAPVHS